MVHRLAVNAVLLSLTYLAAVAVWEMSEPFRQPRWEQRAFYDFRLWRSGVNRYVETGELYDVKTPGYFLAGSHSLYKYPPTYAAILVPLDGEPQKKVAPQFLVAHLGMLVGALVAFAVALRLRGNRLWLGTLIFLTWRPTWESLADLQMELIVLLLLGVAAIFMQNNVSATRAARAGGGMALGVAGAFKVYPWLLLVPFLVRRSWGVLVGAAIGAAAAMGIAATVIPLRYLVQFFFEILPRLGGVSLSYENVSASATIARAMLFVANQLPSPGDLDVMYLEEPRLGTIRIATILVVVAAAAAVGWQGWRHRWWRAFDVARRDVSPPLIALLAISVCATVALIPTSWLSYQILLVFPALYGVAYASTADRITVILLIASLALGTMLHTYSTAFETHTEMFASARTLLPFALAAMILRIQLRTYRQATILEAHGAASLG